MVDIYFKAENDISYDASQLEENTDINNLISQIKMILFTNTGDVMGANNLGINLEKLIFSTDYNKNIILANLKHQIRDYLRYDRNLYNVQFDLNFFKGTIRDIGVLSVDINGSRALDVLIK
jgi:hypothetical protein